MTSFIPVRGAEETILSMGYNEGYVYFATDTGRIFLDAREKEKIPIGGNGVSIFYGHDNKAVKDDVDDTLYTLVRTKIDEYENCHESDLILNSDGCFYKIIFIDVDNELIQATRLAVSGSGGGSSGPSGGGGSVDNTSITITSVTGVETGQIFVYGQSSKVTIRARSSEDPKVTFLFQVSTTYGDTKTVRDFIYTVKNNEDCVFDLGANLTLGTTVLTIQAMSDNVTNVASKKFSALTCVVMSLDASSNFNPLTPFMDQVDFKCIPVGQGITKKLYISIDGKRINSLTQTNITSSGQEKSITIPGNLLGHGYHIITATMMNEEETVSTDLSYNICFIESGNNVPIVWANNPPTSITNHEALNIQYMVYNPADPVHAEVRRYLNGTEIINSPTTESSSEINWLNWRVVGYKVGLNTISISCGSTTLTLSIQVAPDTERELDIIESGLILNLDATGRSNKENETSRMTWAYKDYAVNFSNFNWYNNGWITDDDGETCLRISNGAAISIPMSIMNTAKLQKNLTFEFVFKVRNVKNYGTLINTVVTGSDDNPIITKEVSSTDGVWGSYYKNGIGFCLGTQETFFKSKNSTVSGRFKEDDLVHVSFVLEAPSAGGNNNPLLYIYINGINSGIGKYNIDTDSFASQCQSIDINSNYCDVDLYKVRVYQGAALTAQQVVRNYIADYADAELYDVNQICSYVNNVPTVDYTLMCEYNNKHPDKPLLPYVVIETTDADNMLPYVKMDGDAWKVNIDFVNPTLDYIYNNGGFSNKEISEAGYKSSDEMYMHSCPSFHATNVDLNVQGTSSQGYPRRNYKAKFKGAKEWIYTDGPLKGASLLEKNTLADGTKIGKKWYMDSDIPTNKFTWKADYMDSSGVHNSGFASFVKTLYSKHPLEDYGVPAKEASKYRTSVYGFPMIVFHRDTEGNVEFVGRYNYNLDKGCDDNYGFCDLELDDVHSWVKNPDWSAGAVDGDGKAVPEWLDFGSASECWELCNNQGGRCSFTRVDFAETDVDGKLTVLNDFEVRYHPDGDAIEDAIAGLGDWAGATLDSRNEFIKSKYARFEKVCNWLCSTNPKAATNEPLSSPVTYSGKQYTTDSIEYRQAKFAAELTQHFDKEYCEIYYLMTELLLCYDSRGKNLMLATWGPHEEGGNDIWYPIFYDIDTQLGVNNSGVPYWDYYEEASENGTFSTADSVLWNNLWDTDKDNIKARYGELRGVKLTYNTINGYYNFDPAVSKSVAMRGQRPIVINNIDEYYKYIAPSTSGYVDTNGTSGVISDAFFYCLQGTRELQRSLFLRNRLNFIDSQWQQGSYSVAGAKQGIQMRFDANDYPNTSDKYLEREPTPDEAAAGYIQAEYPQPLDMVFDFSATPYLKQYVSAIYDDTVLPPIYASDGETIVIPTPENKKNDIRNTPHFPQQLVYFGGAEYLSSLGDLSKKYLDQLFMSSAKRLRTLNVGSDVEGYYNKMMNSQSFKPDDSARLTNGNTNPNAKTLLESVNLTNLMTLDGTLDFSGSEKLKSFRALNTIINSVVLADGVQVETLYLPETTTTLKLTEPTSLTGIVTNPVATDKIVESYEPIGVSDDPDAVHPYAPNTYYINTLESGYILCEDEEYNATKTYYQKVTKTEKVYPTGLYLEGITNKSLIKDNDVTHLDTINIIGGQMGYASFKVADTTMKIKEKMQANADLDEGKYNKILYMNFENVKWSPYRLVEHGESIKNDAAYAKKTDHYTFEDYTPSSESDWDKQTLNKRIYEVDTEMLAAEANTITDTSFLDKLIDSYESLQNYFRSTTEYADGRNSIPYISGDLFINNSADNLISESDIKNKYNSVNYFPNLNIYVAHAKEAYIAKFVEVYDSGLEYEWDALKYDPASAVTIHPKMTEKIPIKLNYDFLGWANHQVNYKDITREEAQATVMSADDFLALTFSETNDVFTFYAVYHIHQHQVDFCDETGAIVETQMIPYGSYATLPDAIPWKDDSALDVDKTYKFIGYNTDKNEDEAIDLENYPIYHDFLADKESALYAIFDPNPISVYENIHPEYFVASNYNYIDSLDSTYSLNGVMLRLKKQVKGKLTIPAMFNGKPVVAIGSDGKNGAVGEPGFKANQFGGELTHVFFEGASSMKNIRELNGYCFYLCEKLVYCEFPEGLRNIDTNVFYGAKSLTSTAITGSIYRIGSLAFANAFYGPSGIILDIGSKVASIGSNAFANTRATQALITKIVIGSPEEKSALNSSEVLFRYPAQSDVQIDLYTDLPLETVSAWFNIPNSTISIL